MSEYTKGVLEGLLVGIVVGIYVLPLSRKVWSWFDDLCLEWWYNRRAK